ncbi:MAG: hypothetical protein GY918_11225, partial [Gammaproteobacteria bacterium]|nr:hypothetical protein [Gammaproteobacteria bacterium]
QVDGRSQRDYFVTIDGYSSGAEFSPGHTRLEMRVEPNYNLYSSAAEFGDLLTYNIKIDMVNIGTSAADTIVNTDTFSYVDGKAGNDTITGTSIDETLVGGAGDDIITGGLGDDVIKDGEGVNILAGNDGDDMIDVSATTTPNASIDGGAGRDTLKIAGNTIWSDLDISNMEILAGSGELNLTAAQVVEKGFDTVTGLTFSIDAAAVGGSLDVSSLQGDVNLRGSNQSDVLIGNADDNKIFLNHATESSGSGKALDVVQAGAGDDVLYSYEWKYAQWYHQYTSVDVDDKTYAIEGDFDGGAGNDTLRFEGSRYWYHAWGGYAENDADWNLDLSGLTLTGIESILFNGDANPKSVVFTASQIADLTRLEGVSDIQIQGGGSLDLAHLEDLSLTDKWSIIDDATYNVTGTDSPEQLSLSQGVMNVTLAGGDDTLVIDGVQSVQGSLDGGQGSDTLIIKSGDVDLAGATLSNLENITVSSNSLALSQAQWDQNGDAITVSAGANTLFTLSLDTASNLALTEDSSYQGLSGSVFDDTLTGSDQVNVLVGNAGNDLLQGKGGDDRLIAGPGADTLQGGDGNDRLDVRGKAVVTDTLSGGSGVDTLVVEDGQDLTGANISGIESLGGSGTVTMRSAQLEGFTSIYGVSIQLSDVIFDYSLPSALSLSSDSRILLAENDAELMAEWGVIGTAKDDVLVGSDNDDKLYGGRGSDRLEGGAGDDSLHGGKGTNELVGGDGDDKFFVGGDVFATEWAIISGEKISGGAGTDTLIIDYNEKYGSVFQILEGTTAGIENVTVTNAHPYSYLALSAQSWSSLSSVDITDQERFSLYIDGNHEDIGFSQATNFGSYRSNIILDGGFNSIDLTSNPVSGARGENKYVDVLASFSEIMGSDSADNINIAYDSAFTASLGAGDDYLQLGRNGRYSQNGSLYDYDQRSIKAATAIIDGGSGSDTFDVSGNGFIDLSNVTLVGVENVYHGSSDIVVTDSQFANWSLDGTGAVYTNVNNIIFGTKADDAYSGDGSGHFQGGAGDDSISQVETVGFSGNYADYDFVRNGNALTVEHARGTMADGTDTLSEVLNLQFTDTLYSVDDHPNNPGLYINTSLTNQEQSALLANLAAIEYEKNVSGKFDFSGDVDVYTTTLVPNSPLVIEASTNGGNATYYDFYDVETGQSISFKSLVYGYTYGSYYSWFDPAAKWLPGYGWGDNFEPYQGGEVVLSVRGSGAVGDYAYTLKYLDDYAGSVDTIGEMDAQEGKIRGYVGDEKDHDWVRTELISGTKYEWVLSGLSSGGGSLIDPELALLDSKGRLIESGIGGGSVAGTDDSIVFRPTETGTYYLDVSDIADYNLGSWTLTQESLDTVAGNLTTTERVEWSIGTRFRIESEINQVSDHDWFKVWLDKGVTYDFSMDGTSLGGTLADPQLSLRSVAGRLLAQDDNGGAGSEVALYYSAPDSGWYFLDAGASGNAYKGTYVLQGSALADDYSNDRQTSGTVVLGTKTQGLISYLGDSDWFKTGFSADTTYIIDLQRDISDTARLDPLVDPLLIIRDGAGQVVLVADDFQASLDAKAFFTPVTAGEYYLEAKSAFKYDIGAYSITTALAPADDHGSVLDDSATGIALSEDFTINQTGEIGQPDDKDVFSISLSADKVYLFNANGMANNAGTLVDPYIRLFDSNRNLIDFDDNGGLGNDAEFYFVPPEDGEYFIELSSASYREMGTYELRVSERNLPPDDVPNNLSTDVVLQPGDQFQGNLLVHNDEDWFAINLQQGESYIFKLKGAFSGHGSLHNPALALLDASAGTVASADQMLISNEPAFAYTPLVSGTYYVVVKASDGSTDTGSYTLITRAPDDHANSQIEATLIKLDETIDGGVQYNDGSFGVRAFDSVGLATDFDEDWFTFDASAGDVLSFNAELVDGSLMSRPIVEVVDSAGRTIAIGDGLETDDGLAQAVFKASATGTHFARVTDGAGASGSYQVSLLAGDASDEDVSGSVVMTLVDTDGITMAESIAKIGLSADADQFVVSMLAEHNYRIETIAVRDGSYAPLPGTKMQLHWEPVEGDSEHIEVAGENAAPSMFAATGYTASADGTLQITISAPEITHTGQYKLRVIDLGIDAQDDFADNVIDYEAGTYSVLAINENVAGKIGESDDVDLFGINLSVGNIYDFSVKSFYDGLGTLSQAELKLLNSQGQLVSVGAYDALSGRTDLSISIFEEGRYFLSVSASDMPGNTGTYTLDTRLRGNDLDVNDDWAADTQTSAVVIPGKPVIGEIESAGDHDWMMVQLEAGKAYVLDILADGDGLGGTLPDAHMRLLDSNGEVVAFDDNTGAGLDAHIQISPDVTGSYYIDVMGAGGSTGTYTARVRELYSGIADPLSSAQWYLEYSNINELKGEYTGAGIKVGVIDDGIDTSHPDLQENL